MFRSIGRTFSRWPLWLRVAITVAVISTTSYGVLYGLVNVLHKAPARVPVISVTSRYEYDPGTPGDVVFSYVRDHADQFGQTDSILEFYAYVGDGPVIDTTSCFDIRVTNGINSPETFFTVEVHGSTPPVLYGVSHLQGGEWVGVGKGNAQACVALELAASPSPGAPSTSPTK